MGILYKGERLRDMVGRRPTLAQGTLASTAFLALCAALVLSCIRTHVGTAPSCDVLLVWTAVSAFLGSLSASGLVWAMTVNDADDDYDYSHHGFDARPVPAPRAVAATSLHPASLSLLIDALDALGGHWTLAR